MNNLNQQMIGKSLNYIIKTIETFNAQEVKVADFTLNEEYKPEAPVEGNDFEMMKGSGHVCKVNSSRVEDYAESADQHWSDPSWWKPELVGHTFLNYELEVVQTKGSTNYNGRKVWKRIDLNDDTKSKAKKPKTPLEKLADTFFGLGLEFSNIGSLRSANDKFVDMEVTVSFGHIPAARTDSGKDVPFHKITGKAAVDGESTKENTSNPDF